MIDTAKRNTLKVLSVAAASTATAGSSIAAVLRGESATIHGELPELAQINVTTRVSAQHNDLEVVLTNAGTQPATITHMTPRITHVPRGQFNFSRLTENGPLSLAAGESVTVPLEHKSVKMWAPSTGSTTSSSLSETLRSTISVVTEGNSFASVNIDSRLPVA